MVDISSIKGYNKFMLEYKLESDLAFMRSLTKLEESYKVRSIGKGVFAVVS